MSIRGFERLGGDRDAADQPAAADRRHDRVEIGPVGEEFERDRPLAGDDRRIVIGVDKGEPVFMGERLGRFARGDEAVALQHDIGAQAFCALDLDERGAFGHDDSCRDTEAPGVIGHPLGMIAGRHRDDAGLPLRRAEGQQFVQRAALLERAGAVQGFELQMDLAAGELGQPRRGDGRRALHRAGDRRGGAADIGDRYRQIIHGCSFGM